MKIKVKADGKNINVRIPNFLLCSRLAFKIIEKSIKNKSGKKIDKETKQKIRTLFKKTIKEYKGMQLVEIHSAEGEIVEITL